MKSDERASREQEALDHLRLMHLPLDYMTLTNKGKQAARLKVLKSWYDHDPSRANILCNNVDNLVAAHRVWVTMYYRPDAFNAGTYYHKDPTHKWEMVRQAMSDPILSSQPAKTLVKAPRGSTKTVTLIQELVPLIAVCRPHSQILISESNSDRTTEEMNRIKKQIQENEHIRADFGEIWPRKRSHGDKWSDKVLSFTHHSSSIHGYSVESKMRGRHPVFGIIDDPEDDEQAANPEWRKKYFNWLFRTYLPMFGKGGKVLWIGTEIGKHSALALAMTGASNQEALDDGEVQHDERFDSWGKKAIQLYYNDSDGVRRSVFEDKHSVESEGELIKAMGRAAYMAEMQGNSIGSGDFVFARDKYKHGFMKCENPNGTFYHLDLMTGEQTPWDDWMEGLLVFGAVDLSDSLAPSACPGAIVFVGVDKNRNFFVVDVYNKRTRAPELVKIAFEMSAPLKAERIGWESAGMQCVVARLAARHGEELRAKGCIVPGHVALPNTGKEKIRRILAALSPLMDNYEMRFMQFDEFVDDDGVKHAPAPVSQRKIRHFRDLEEQVDCMTDEGGPGFVDAIDALEMAVRVAANARGVEPFKKIEDVTTSLDEWLDLGVSFDPSNTPLEGWTPEMIEQTQVAFDDHDPYDIYE